MTMYAKTLFIIAVAASIPQGSTAQTVVRTDDATVRVRFKADISIAAASFRLIIGSNDTAVPATIDGRDIVVKLSQDESAAIRQRTNFNGTSFLDRKSTRLNSS